MVVALVDNAEELLSEATVLYQSSHYARAYSLAHFAREELSKCVMLHAVGAKLLAGNVIDWKETMRRLHDHKAKIRIETVQNAMIAAAYGDMENAEAMALNAELFASYRNKRKNESLYVNLDEGHAVKPSEVVSDAQALRTIKLAEIALQQEQGILSRLGPLAKRQPLNREHITQALEAENIIDVLFEQIAPMYREVLRGIFNGEEESNT